MVDRWTEFVRDAAKGEADDSSVTLLRSRLESGARVLQAKTDERDGRSYVLLIERLKELSEMRVPHSAAFTRFCLQHTTRMMDATHEAVRVRWWLDDELATAARHESSRDWFLETLVERVRELAPPLSTARLSVRRDLPPARGQSRDRARAAIDAALQNVSTGLTGSLGYNADEAAGLLDRALADSLRESLHLDALGSAAAIR